MAIEDILRRWRKSEEVKDQTTARWYIVAVSTGLPSLVSMLLR
jgi:hypothetical protein